MQEKVQKGIRDAMALIDQVDDEIDGDDWYHYVRQELRAAQRCLRQAFAEVEKIDKERKP